MGIILLFIVIGLSIALPVKCHEDGMYKTKCLEMRGRLELQGTESVCTFEAEKERK